MSCGIHGKHQFIHVGMKEKDETQTDIERTNNTNLKSFTLFFPQGM